MPSDVAHGSAPPIPPDLFDVTVVSPDSAGVRVDVSTPTAKAYRAFLKLQAATGGGAVVSASGGAVAGAGVIVLHVYIIPI